ncbi:uncharacterized protein [Nicotiana tomentosiformis]|uniref:uncharacterized protein n=1 Tax=Nicotiana tomentosiformis TaxID=4098 RepID=UPI00388C3616
MTVSEYAVRFGDLARHAPAFVATVRERVRRFIEGLNPSIRLSMARELEMDIAYQQVVGITRRLEGMLNRDKEEREGKRSEESGTYSGTLAPAAARQGRGYMGLLVHSVLLATSGAPATTRPHDPYYAPPVSSMPPVRGAFSGQSNRSGPSQLQQPHPPRACFECGDTRHVVRDCPRFKRGMPLQISQAPRAPLPTTSPPAQPTRGRGRTGRGRPRGGGQTIYYALPARMEAIASNSVITGIVQSFIEIHQFYLI